MNWLGREHPDITSMAQLDRALIEEYLRWLPTYSSQNTGQPLHVTTRKHEINAIAAFCRDTGIWGWDDVPGRPLLTTRDAPRRQETIPRYLPRHELDALMTAIGGLADRAFVTEMVRCKTGRNPATYLGLPRHLRQRTPQTSDPGWQRPFRTARSFAC